jgi:hypothetical protein
MQPILVTDFIKHALKRILQNSDTPTAKISGPQMEDALAELNLITDSYDTDPVLKYTQTFNTFPLVPGQQVYTIGPDQDNGANVANFSTGVNTRPMYLEFASFEQTTSNPFLDIPIKILSEDEWMSIRTKNISTDICLYIYMDGSYPWGNIYLWPLPQVSSNLVLTYWQTFNGQLTLQSQIALPPGYARLTSLELSLNMCPFYGKAGAATAQQIAGPINTLKRKIGWMNLRGSRLQYSGESQSSRGGAGVYDAVSDQKL